MANELQTLIASTEESFKKANPDFAANYAREAGFAMQLIQASTALQQCSHESLRNAVMRVAQIGITLNPALKLAYLIPRGGQCCLDLSFQGMTTILAELGIIHDASAYLVYPVEFFEWIPSDMKLTHIASPFAVKRKEDILGGYVRVLFTSGIVKYEVMNVAEMNHIRDVYSKKNPVWNTETEEMYKKTLIRRAFKNSPKAANNAANAARLSALIETVDAEASEAIAEKQLAAKATTPVATLPENVPPPVPPRLLTPEEIDSVDLPNTEHRAVIRKDGKGTNIFFADNTYFVLSNMEYADAMGIKE
jgi:phage RecT family recombinase